jgi:cell wall-active antibiotic response 4TMS protein YvqF
MAKPILTETLAEPLNDTTTAKVEIQAGDGNLTIDGLTSGEALLASGTLQYVEEKGLPVRMLVSRNGQATLTLKGSKAGQRWFRFPWATCNGATKWQIALNPTVVSDITAHSSGGNIKLNLAGMAITHLAADTGGGNLDVVLPDDAANLEVAVRTGGGNVGIELGSGMSGSSSVKADSGAGKVSVRVPNDLADRIQATSGLGKVTVDSRFTQMDKHTYQSPDFERAANQIEIMLHSGMGEVSVRTK